jgi:hypothetical protein
MRRFVYSPKVEALIKLDGTDGRVIDVTRDLISGTVNRRVDAMSTAQIQLQNKNGKYTKRVFPNNDRNVIDPHHARIMPMDRIVIYLKRVGQPIQVFSGYVDEAAYYQLYPGPITITASCTIKLLQHTYFDPGLPFVSQWMADMGFAYDFSSGMLYAPNGFGNLDLKGTVAKVIRQALIDIVGWNPKNIDIVGLPNAFIEAMAQRFLKDTGPEDQQLFKVWIDKIRDFLSIPKNLDTTQIAQQTVSSSDSASGSVGKGQFPEGLPHHGVISDEKIAELAIGAGWVGTDRVTAVAIALAESGGQVDNTYHNEGGSTDYGLWQMNDEFNGGSEKDFDPVYNAKHAYSTWLAGKRSGSRGSCGPWGDWCTYKPCACGGNGNNRYAQFLGRATAAVRKAEAKVGTGGGQANVGNVKSGDFVFPLPKGAKRNVGGPHSADFGNWWSDHARDFFGPHGTPVLAAEDGQLGGAELGGPGFGTGGVSKNSINLHSGKSFGANVYFKGVSGTGWWYEHMDKITVRPGQKVKKGQVIGHITRWDDAPSSEHVHVGSNPESSVAALANSAQVPLVSGGSAPAAQNQIVHSKRVKGYQAMIDVIHHANRVGMHTGENPASTDHDNPTPGDGVHVPTSYHYRRYPGHPNIGEASDITGTPKQMATLWQWVRDKYPGVSELFYTPKGLVKFGAPIHDEEVAANHYDHVHVAFGEGDFQVSGGTGVYVGGDAAPYDGASLADTVTSSPILTQKGVGQLSAAVASQASFFQTQFASTDYLLSTMLTGKRAMANDIPFIEWLNSFIKASGRVYMSKGNGDFYAFFPDHFGFFGRTPYFKIADIEIIDLTIQENDTDLVTHLFAAGPRQQPIPSIENYDRLFSMVASVQEAAFDDFLKGVLDDPLTPGKEALFTPEQFLRRYGARPMVEDMPEIYHPLLLWISAWMKFMDQWAKRFTASATFTFMPELFPGGRVDLVGKIAMYIESVTHNFDRASGFTTTCELSSPVSITIGQGDLPSPGGQYPNIETVRVGALGTGGVIKQTNV